MKRYVLAILVLCVVIGLEIGATFVRRTFVVDVLPEYSSVTKTVWLDQNWPSEQRNWFHHADQGTQTFHIPYEWLTALDQPASSLSFAIDGLLSDSHYLDRYGFIPEKSQSGPTE